MGMNVQGNHSNSLPEELAPRFPDPQGRTVFITGGGSGIGAEFTRAFTDQGTKVGFVLSRQEIAERLCNDTERQTQVRPFYIRCDIRDIDALIHDYSLAFSGLGISVSLCASEQAFIKGPWKLAKTSEKVIPAMETLHA